jgi:hypothetical protein
MLHKIANPVEYMPTTQSMQTDDESREEYVPEAQPSHRWLAL